MLLSFIELHNIGHDTMMQAALISSLLLVYFYTDTACPIFDRMWLGFGCVCVILIGVAAQHCFLSCTTLL